LICQAAAQPWTGLRDKQAKVSSANSRRLRESRGVSRREWVRLTIGGGAGLALSGLLDLSAVKAANENQNWRT